LIWSAANYHIASRALGQLFLKQTGRAVYRQVVDVPAVGYAVLTLLASAR
jgi:hypothetical protein